MFSPQGGFRTYIQLNPLPRLGSFRRPNLQDRLRSLHQLLSGSVNDDGS